MMRRSTEKFTLLLIYGAVSVFITLIFCLWSIGFNSGVQRPNVRMIAGAHKVHYLEVQKNVLPESPQEPQVIQILSPQHVRSFEIDYDHDVFLKDGKPFYYISGEFHYFRAKRDRWRDILRKHRAAGLNCVCTYVEWSSHEKVRGSYDFRDENDLEYFLTLAAEEDLLVILRPGPYICAERDYGGFPPWLLTLYPDIKIRTTNENYLNEVSKWFKELFSRLKQYLYGNNGPIIMVQVENEYGSFSACDMDYRLWLRDELKKHVGDAALLFTTDMPKEEALTCGSIPDVYATVDFGTRGNAELKFAEMRKFSTRGPLVNSEFYPGWLDHWGEPMKRIPTEKVLESIKKLLDMKANFNFYMFFGGTNFFFMNGANYIPSNSTYEPDITSYDYDAPLDEAGDPTPKYFAIRDLLSEHGYCDIPDNFHPEVSPKGNYGKVQLKPALSLFNLSHIYDDKISLTSELPKTFEEMGLMYGYALYETKIPAKISGSALLTLPGLSDRCNVFLDHSARGVLSRMANIYNITLQVKPGQTLSLLVENQGRINFKDMNDPKGLLSVPLLNNIPLTGWTITGFPFEKIPWMMRLSPSTENITAPAFYVGDLVLPQKTSPLDTYIDPSGWGKGLIFVNDCHLGRYWPSLGPQVNLYVPSSCLTDSKANKIIFFETDQVPTTREIIFKDKPNLDKSPPSTSKTSTSNPNKIKGTFHYGALQDATLNAINSLKKNQIRFQELRESTIDTALALCSQKLRPNTDLELSQRLENYLKVN